VAKDISVTSAVAANLLKHLPPDRVLYGGSSDRRIWNGAVNRAPALIVRPHTPAEVGIAVLTARSHDLPLSVLVGGNDWVGRSLRDGGLVVDLTEMRNVVVNPHLQIATVEGGATAGDVVAAAQLHGLTAATGTTGGVGMAGLTLGGGYGPTTCSAPTWFSPTDANSPPTPPWSRSCTGPCAVAGATSVWSQR
jgi:FAD/FMN-containing dehydrogenase